jgi:hypothetical protein
MRELNQSHINYITLINVIAILGIIFFFYRKWKEMMEREEVMEKRIAGLEKNVTDNSNHVKAVLTHINKRLNSAQINNTPQPPQRLPQVEEEVKTEERDDFEEAMALLG